MSDYFKDFNDNNSRDPGDDFTPAHSGDDFTPAQPFEDLNAAQRSDGFIRFDDDAASANTEDDFIDFGGETPSWSDNADDPTPADRVFSHPYTHPQQSPDGTYHSAFNRQSGAYNASFNRPAGARPAPTVSGHTAPPKSKPARAKVSAGAVALILVVCVVISGFVGFGGSLLAGMITGNSQQQEEKVVANDSNTLVIHQVEASTTTATTGALVDKTTAQITEEVADAVVEITTETIQTSSFYGQYIAQGAGSGVIISDDGYILTNNHVIEGASSVKVTLRSGESYDAQVIGADSTVDIALLKIDASGLTSAVFGDSSTLKVGDKSVIIGNPLGTLGGSVTEGIISALNRDIVIDGKTMTLLQTDAAINPGNSGGGMFNGQGELCGIVVAKSSTTSGESTIDNIGFVIPINNVLSILSDLKDYGYTRGRADTGMEFMDLTNSMYSSYYFGNPNPGCYITSVNAGSAAEQAGFRQGDRVVSVDGTEIESSEDIKDIISKHSVGDTVEFVIERSRAGALTLTLTLEEEKPSNV